MLCQSFQSCFSLASESEGHFSLAILSHSRRCQYTHRLFSSHPPPTIARLDQVIAPFQHPGPLRNKSGCQLPAIHIMRLSPHYKSRPLCSDLVFVSSCCEGQGPPGSSIRSGENLMRRSSLLGWCKSHDLADEVLQQLPVVESSLAPDEVVTDPWEGK
jgi:hypothetical protein